jgi:transposase-like protein
MPTSRPNSVFTRPRWNAEDAREVIDALERSGQSVGAFAAEHELDPQRVYLWRRRLGVGAARSSFQEVVVRPSVARHDWPQGWFEVALASGTVVRVPAVFDAAALTQLLAVLVRSGAC